MALPQWHAAYSGDQTMNFSANTRRGCDCRDAGRCRRCDAGSGPGLRLPGQPAGQQLQLRLQRRPARPAGRPAGPLHLAARHRRRDRGSGLSPRSHHGLWPSHDRSTRHAWRLGLRSDGRLVQRAHHRPRPRPSLVVYRRPRKPGCTAGLFVVSRPGSAAARGPCGTGRAASAAPRPPSPVRPGITLQHVAGRRRGRSSSRCRCTSGTASR